MMIVETLLKQFGIHLWFLAQLNREKTSPHNFKD